MSKQNLIILLVSIFLIIFFISINLIQDKDKYLSKNQMNDISSKKVTIYKSPTCGCCVQYKDYLEKNGYEVKVIETEDMQAIKDKYQIPREMESCHTAIIDNYFIEGHIPLAVINQLIDSNIEVDGLALPNMPAGSPGMPGRKNKPFNVYTLKSGESSLYVKY